MCPLRIIPKLFLFDEKELEPELRAQRVLNRARIPAMSQYIIDNPRDYVFSAITASIDGDIEFIPINSENYDVGHLRIPMSAKLLINDGQHRRAAIEAALLKKPELGNETIACVFFMDTGLKRSQQMFSDLNRYAIRPTRSLDILYDYRDPHAQLSRDVVRRVRVFSDMTEMDKTTISNRSTKLFTLSGVHRATAELLGGESSEVTPEMLDLAVDYWNEVAAQIPEWGQAKRCEVSAASLRQEYVHAHTVALVALGRAGHSLLEEWPRDWQVHLAALRDLDWLKENTRRWEGRAMVGGKVSISQNNVVLLTSEIKKVLGLPLNDEENAAENALASSRESMEVVQWAPKQAAST
jgi:DNA sulfur modification protein DndB